MAMASGLFGPFIRDVLNNDKAIDLSADAIDMDLVTDAYTPNFNTHDELVDVTNIVTGTGWAGAINLASPTLTIGAGVATFDGTDVSQAGTTLSSVRGLVLWDDTIAGDPLVASVNFGADYNTVSGTFAITWNASGIFTIDYTP